jgi:hypothetical protein
MAVDRVLAKSAAIKYRFVEDGPASTMALPGQIMMNESVITSKSGLDGWWKGSKDAGSVETN